jgi:NitT/TauT family transport system ATP-binding protein
MVTHDIREAFTLGTRVLALDKRRHDPHAPHRFGATAVYDLTLRRPDKPPEDEQPEDELIVTLESQLNTKERIGHG